MTDRTQPRRPRTRRARIALLSLLAVALPWSLSAAPAAPTAEQLGVARDYVVTARFVDLLDGMVNYMAENSAGSDSENDLAMKRRIVRDMSREVMTDSLARSLASNAPIEVLKAGLAHAKSDIGRIEFACLSRWPQPAEGYQGCIEAGANKTQILRLAEHGETESGWPLVGKLLKGDAIVIALTAATRDLVARDPEIAAQLSEYCQRKPGEGMCGAIVDKAPATPPAAGGSDGLP
ncbi:hypothetical protein [Lysobacter sp. cf310]|uniref:hypothetical protein n=1 Tax=Lysobacter sp. cf310 TaxID=1761790 RepID=UPI0008E4E955|nr:hypothetical protein [Lysobacter sp. cf310]SFK65668.1 hypothetical protein SAMN04487938_1461 [Lysobacter sp. cf310]